MNGGGVAVAGAPPASPVSELEALQALYDLTDRLLRAGSHADIFEAALDAIELGLGCPRASILLFDELGVMRFVAWRGLSDQYRSAVEGHTPWRPGEEGASPITIGDINSSEEADDIKATIRAEGIGALAFVPLTVSGGVIGKFMVYRPAPHDFGEVETRLALTIARQLGFALERHRAEDRARRSAEQFGAVFDNIPVMIKLFEPKTGRLRLNWQFTRTLGWTSTEAASADLMSELFPDPAVRARVRGNMDRCEPGWFDVAMVARDGRRLESSWANIRLSDGSRVGIGIDITERKQALERQELLLREMDHRVRNLFSLTSSMVRLSAREPGDRAGLARDLEERLAALAAAHALTMRKDGEGAGAARLHDLIRAILAPYRRGLEGQLDIVGQDLPLDGEAATSFAILLYELATNAAKYGALSRAGGKVSIATRLTQQDLELDWEETGGPVVAAEPSAGFGSRLSRAAVAQLGGDLQQVWRPEGLQIHLSAALDRCLPDDRLAS
ncbi:HWE histidine kinase domain-containing protein [Phenylobacterium sp.]|uniref:sensor histidine kinase n=1 Tax=Phenylobacterium sp. TaxID=1871053 RepID=UPI0025F27C09|nr:HWE histidine kinase domain-containing protein [Phenylobacterium sp.]